MTNNRRHFLREYLKQDLHNGLVVIVPNVERDSQMNLFARVLDHLSDLSELPVDKLVEVLEDGSIHVRDWTRDDHDIGHITSPPWSNR